MRDNLLNVAWLGIASVLFLSAPVLASHQRPSSASEESAIRTLMSQWVEAYQHLDAKRIATLEVPDVEIVDRFGELHLPSSRDENEHLWSDAFETVSEEPLHQL